MKINYVIILVRSRGKLVTTLMTIESAEKKCKLLSHTTKHSKDFAIVIKSGLSVDMLSMGRACRFYYQFLNRNITASSYTPGKSRHLTKHELSIILQKMYELSNVLKRAMYQLSYKARCLK